MNNIEADILRVSPARRKAAAATKVLVATLNTMGSKPEAIQGIVDVLAREHRYLQNKTIWSLIEALGFLANAPTDARNEAAIKACSDIRETFKSQIYWKDSP